MCFEKDEPKLLRKRKVSNHYEEGETSVELISKVEEHYRQFFYQAIDMVVNCSRNIFQQKDYIETLQTMETPLWKALHEEDFGHELQQMLSFFYSDLDKSKLETQLKTLIHLLMKNKLE